LRDADQLLYAHIGQYASLGYGNKRLAIRIQNLLGINPDTRFKFLKGLFALRIACQVGDIFRNDQLEKDPCSAAPGLRNIAPTG